MVTFHNGYRIVFIEGLYEFGIFQIRINKLRSESGAWHIKKKIEFFTRCGVLVRRPARPVPRFGQSNAHQQPRAFNILGEHFVDVAIIWFLTDMERERIAAFYFLFEIYIMGRMGLIGRSRRFYQIDVILRRDFEPLAARNIDSIESIDFNLFGTNANAARSMKAQQRRFASFILARSASRIFIENNTTGMDRFKRGVLRRD